MCLVFSHNIFVKFIVHVLFIFCTFFLNSSHFLSYCLFKVKLVKSWQSKWISHNLNFSILSQNNPFSYQLFIFDFVISSFGINNLFCRSKTQLTIMLKMSQIPHNTYQGQTFEENKYGVPIQIHDFLSLFLHHISEWTWIFMRIVSFFPEALP